MSSIYDQVPDFGLVYDHVPIYIARPDVGFYVEEATRAQGRVLELGCGTGRILLPIARAGCSITGLDSSPAMIARCREKVAAEPAPVRSRITLDERDIRDARFGGDASYRLVIAPFRVLQHLTTVDEQVECFTAVARLLSPGGRFTFDVFNPHFAALTGADGTEREDTPEQRLPDGRSFRRAARVKRVRWVDQVSEIELIYYVSGQRYVQAFDMRWYLRAELLHLLARSGFRACDIYGDFNRAPVGDSSPELVVSAERA